MNAVVETFRWLVETLLALPVLMLVLVAIPFLVVAGVRKTYPTVRLAATLIIPAALSLILLAKADALPLVITADLIIALIAIVDLVTLPPVMELTLERHLQRVASIRKPHKVQLQIVNSTKWEFQLSVRDDLPAGFVATPDRFDMRLAPFSRAKVKYQLEAGSRGAFTLESVHLRSLSKLGLWQEVTAKPLTSELHVYPDMQQLSKYAILAKTNRLSLMGFRRTRKIGQDHEFERLRDYSRDDNYKHIDWRTTARRNKLTVKDYQMDQSQRIVFLIDCGRMMTNQVSGMSLLDHSLNAMLMLSYVALRQGDAVGMLSFSDTIHTYVPPTGGLNQMNRLLHASFDRFPQLCESRYDQAFLHLDSHCRKRSLVVLMTNVIDEVNALQVQQYLGTLAPRHLPLGVVLRDRELFNAADRQDHPSDESRYASAAAAEILTWRHHVLTDLQHRGVLVLDAFPEQMTTPLVNRYLELKARHAL